jgi:hypothetical protein
LFEIGLLPEDRAWANFIAEAVLGSECPASCEPYSFFRLDMVFKLKPDSNFESSPNFDPTATCILSIEMDEKGLSANHTKYVLYPDVLVNTHGLKTSKKLYLLFCAIFGTGVNPTEQEEQLPLRLSSDMIEIKFIYLSKMDADEVFNSFKNKLESKQLPSLYEFYQFMNLPELIDRSEKKKKSSSADEKTKNFFSDPAFDYMLVCQALMDTHKDIDTDMFKDFSVLLFNLYNIKFSEDRKKIVTKEGSPMKESLVELVIDKYKYINMYTDAEKTAQEERAKAEKAIEERARAEKALREERARAEKALEEIALRMINSGMPRDEILRVLNITDAKLKSFENQGQ